MTIRTASQSKGIFCIEGNWVKDLRMPQTVRPLLNLLLFNANIPYIHRDCATRTELEFYLGKWVLKKYAAYPILYLASHGEQFGILLDEGNYSLDQIAERLQGRCENRIILIASCVSWWRLSPTLSCYRIVAVSIPNLFPREVTMRHPLKFG